MDEKDFVPDGSGTVIINICNSDGKVVKTQYANLSEIGIPEVGDNNNGNIQ